MALQIRRGTDAERTAGGGVVFAEGELIYVTDTDTLYVGDGSTAGGVLLTGSALATIGDYIVADTINSTLDLQQDLDLNGNDIIGTGNININGTITATGNINIGDDADADTVDFTAKITSTLTPNADSTYNIGAADARWNNGYFTGLVVDGQIDAVAVNADVVADNSTVMVDVSANTFTGDITGNVTGNIAGNVTTNSIVSTSGNIVIEADNYVIIDSENNGQINIGQASGVGNILLGNKANGTDISILGDVIMDAGTTISGNLTGDVTGDVTGNVAGDLTGDVKGSGGGSVLSPNTGTADAELSVLNILATGTITGDVTGDVTGNTTGYHTGDVKGSVFGDDSTPIVDAVANQVNATGGFVGNLTGNVTGNVFTNLVDSDDSSEIVVVPALRTQSDLTVENSLTVQNSINVGTGGITLRGDGSMNVGTLEAAIVTDNGFGSLFIDTTVELSGGITSPGLGRFTNNVDIIWINDSDGKSLTVQKFTGDTESEIDLADPNNYSVYAQVDDSKAAFGVPVKFPVVADDTARTALVPTPEKGMVILMEAGTAPAATNQLQFYNGTGWTNV